MATTTEAVGIKEIADRIGKSRIAVRKWSTGERFVKTAFPRPRWEVSGYPAWNWAEVEKWVEKNLR